jgi:DNA-binding transcriptional ArsR family regulator
MHLKSSGAIAGNRRLGSFSRPHASPLPAWITLGRKESQLSSRPVADLLSTLAEPTRLRIVNCLSSAPLFVSDLSAILDVPDTVVVEHLELLEELGVVRTYEVVPYLLYTLAPLPGAGERLLRSVLDAVRNDAATQADRSAALDRSRARLETRVRGAVVNAS